jgi:hypothetical protein
MQRVAGRSAGRLLLILESMLNKNMPRNKYSVLYTYQQKDFSGDSYLLDPWALFLDKTYTLKEKADYIGLASFRNYSEYLLTNDASLDILHCPLNEEQLKQNRLLSIENGRILFKYEEVANRRDKNGTRI